MKLKDYMTIENRPESMIHMKYEDFVNDKNLPEKYNNEKLSKEENPKKKENKKPKKIKKYSDLPLKTRKKIIKNLKFPSDNNYYTKYGNRLDYYQ